ncbi:protein NLRC3-like protein, partial [Lates japonicus]
MRFRVDQESSEVPSGQSAQQHQTHLDSIFMLLEENIVTFVKNELKKMQKVLSPDYPECLESQRRMRRCWVGERDEEQRRSSREEFLKITLNFLRRMKQEELADCLQSNLELVPGRPLTGHLDSGGGICGRGGVSWTTHGGSGADVVEWLTGEGSATPAWARLGFRQAGWLAV